MNDNRYQAALFDLDGTLLDTIDDLAAAMNATLTQFGFATHPVEDHKWMVGDGVRNYIVQALPESRRHDETLIAAITPVYRDAYATGWAGKTQAYEGVAEMLAGLAAKGVRLSVLSNKPEEFTCVMVQRYFGDVDFEIVRGARPDVPLKPDPAAAIEVARQMNLPGEQFLYVGDTATDMKTARGAGMFAVGVLWGFRPESELTAGGAQTIIAHPAELVELA